VPDDDRNDEALPTLGWTGLTMSDRPLRLEHDAIRGMTQLESRTIRGREPEQRAVLELVRGAAKGRSGALLVEGELGSGKSLLLSYAAGAARQAGVPVASAAADELSRFMPMGALLSALGESPGALADETDRRGEGSLPIWLIEALRSRLEKHAAVGPLLVSLDDLHWADPATLHALRTLPWQLASYPLAWILSRHSAEPDNGAGLLFDLLEREGAARVSLLPLGDAAAAELVTDAVGAVPDPGLAALAAGAAGNPLLLTELVGGLLEEGAVTVTGGRACLKSAHVPRRIQTQVRDTLDGLDTGTRLLLETAAVLGRSFRLEDAATMLGTSAAALLPAVDEALGARLLVEAQDELTFRHELVWRAISASLPVPVRQALHQQIAEILLARGGSAASAAAHLLTSARSGDLAALAGLDQAAVEVLPSAPAIAADLATRALELTPPGDPELIPRSLTAAQALTAAGRFTEATDLTRSVLALPLPATTTARLRCALSSSLWMSGQATAALAQAQRVLAEPQLPADLRADAKIALLQGLIGLRDSRRAGLLVDSILAAPEQESGEVLITALIARAMILWDAGRLAEALARSADAVRLAADLQPGVRRCHPHLFLASRLVDLRRLDEARNVMRAAANCASLPGMAGWSATPATLRARMLLAAGRLADAEAEAEAELGVARALGSHLHGSGAPAILATVALRRGDLNAAARHVQATQAWGLGPAYADTWDTVVAAQVEEAKKDPGAALNMLADVYAELGRHRFLLMCDPACAAWLTRCALAAGHPQSAAAAAAAAGEIARSSPGVGVAAAAAAHAEGILARDPARLERAAAEHADAWSRASAAEDLGELLAAEGSQAGAIAGHEQAIQGYEAAGAARDVARVRRRLRRLGVRRRHWAVGSRPSTGWPSLTGTEHTVSELASQGFTNQQVADQMFISVHTVAFHLRQVFRKLGISSRVELARIAAEQHPQP
jgi:DNA-binding CsgD family transcriptional regulator/tetratricopeptide (TPR) repeat protein